MKSQEELQDAADRAFELLERKSPHQLAVELVSVEVRLQTAIDACARMQEQRDQLAFQLKDATAQCSVAADLLRELREGAEIHLHNCTVCKNEQGIANWTSKLERIDAALAGKMPGPFIIAGGELPELTAEEVKELQRCGPIIRVKKPGAEYLQGASDFKQELIKATRVLVHPHIEGVFAVFEGRHGCARNTAAPMPEGGA